MMPIRIQRKRTKGWRMPENTVYVGRPTRWGNPWKPLRDDDYELTARAVLREYEQYISELQCDPYFDLNQLRGKNLACFCPLDQPCHADILLELANK